MKSEQFFNDFYTIKTSKSEKIEVLYVETQTDKFNINIEGNQFREDILTKDEKNLIISKLKHIDDSKLQQNIAENIIKKLEGKTFIPADVFVKSGQIGDICMSVDENATILDIIREILDQAFLEKIQELGARNQQSRESDLPKSIQLENFYTEWKCISTFISGATFCAGNSYTINKIISTPSFNLNILQNDSLEEGVLVFGKKTEIDKPGVVCIIKIDDYDNIIYTVEKNILSIKSNMFDIGFFPQKHYFTTHLNY